MHSELLVNLALAGIDDLTRKILRESWPVVRERVPQVLDALYGQGTYRPGFKPQSVSDDARMAEAREAQARHWEALFAADFDDEYAASVSRIALTHVRVGLRPAWFISGYLVALTELHSLLLNAHSESIVTWRSRTRMEQAIRAIDKAVLFDLQLGVTAYCAEMEAGYRRRLEAFAAQSEADAIELGERAVVVGNKIDATLNDVIEMASLARTTANAIQEGTTRAIQHITSTTAAVEKATVAIDSVTRQANAAATATVGAAGAVDAAARLNDGLGAATGRMAEVVGLLEQLSTEAGALTGTDPAVAAQIKALSARLAATAASLRTEVGKVQTMATGVTGAIVEVHATLGEVRTTTGAIAGAMARQADATREIGQASTEAARAVASLERGVGSSGESAARSAAGAQELAVVSEGFRQYTAERAAAADSFVRDLRSADRRAEPREPASASIILTVGGRDIRGVLSDVSAGGAAVLLDTTLVPDDHGPMFVRAPHVTASAAVTVAHRHPNRLHLAFDDRGAAQAFVSAVLDRTSSLSAAEHERPAKRPAERAKLDFAAPHHQTTVAPPDAVLCAAIPRYTVP